MTDKPMDRPITMDEWRAANARLTAEECRRTEPPTAEELLSYQRGELSGAAEERVRSRIACYPEIVRLLLTEFPTAGAEPSNPDYMTAEDFAVHWRRLRWRIRTRRLGRALRTHVVNLVLSALLAVSIAASIHFHAYARRIDRAPRAADQIVELLPAETRCLEAPHTPIEIGAGANAVLFDLWIGDARTPNAFTVELYDETYPEARSHREAERIAKTWKPKLVWSASNVPGLQDRSASIVVLVPTAFVPKGQYRFVVTHGAAKERVSTFKFRTDGKGGAGGSGPCGG